MMEPQGFPNISDLLKRKGIWLDKKKSQHFLKRQEVCRDIAELAAIEKDDLVIEVGAGTGNLSVELAARAGRVVAVEMDPVFADWHEYLQAGYPALRFSYQDFLQADLEALVAEHQQGGKLIGVGNLPYQITAGILFKFVDSPLRFQRLVFMVQKEVAERVCCGVADRGAGALTYKIALRYRAEMELIVPAEEFLPPPKVQSAVMVLHPLEHPLVEDEAHRKSVYTLLDQLFRYRRKTLLNILQLGGFLPGKHPAEEALRLACIDGIRRPETLTIEEVLQLHKAVVEVRHGQ